MEAKLQLGRLILALCLLGFILVANAGEARLSWAAPTQNTDGSPLTNLAGYRVLYGPSPTTLNQTAQVTSTSFTVPNLAPGTWYFAVRAYTTSGVESANSNLASKVIPPTVPNPPTALKVIETTAYRLDLGYADQVKIAKIGTVPLGIACKEARYAELNLVPRVSLSTTGSRPLQVWAKCG